MKFRVHDSESIAVRYILDHLEERAFVLLVFNSISAQNMDYTLRFNYTTLPNTNLVESSLLKAGLNTNYQSYILSGFLSVQVY